MMYDFRYGHDLGHTLQLQPSNIVMVSTLYFEHSHDVRLHITPTTWLYNLNDIV